MKKETFVQMVDYGQKGDNVVVHYSQLVGVNSRGNFKITIDRMKHSRLQKEGTLIYYLENEQK